MTEVLRQKRGQKMRKVGRKQQAKLERKSKKQRFVIRGKLDETGECDRT